MSIIRRRLKQDILSGRYSSELRLPGVRKLADRYGCSHGTVANELRILAEEGLIRTEQGRGTFITLKNDVPVQRSHMVGAILLGESWMEKMEELRESYLSRGWFISSYCSSDDLQDPEKEQQFLKMARHQNFAGVMLVGTPRAPVNTEFYYHLRRSGMKIIHLTYYQDNMLDEAAILPDYCMAGETACAAAAIQGKNKIAFLIHQGYRPPSSRLREEGMDNMARALGLTRLPDLVYEEKDDRRMITRQSFEKFMEFYDDWQNVAVLSDSCFFILGLNYMLQTLNIEADKSPWRISMSDTSNLREEMNYIGFDYGESIRLAMEYIMDDKINPMLPYCQSLKPVLHLHSESV